MWRRDLFKVFCGFVAMLILAYVFHLNHSEMRIFLALHLIAMTIVIVVFSRIANSE